MLPTPAGDVGSLTPLLFLTHLQSSIQTQHPVELLSLERLLRLGQESFGGFTGLNLSSLFMSSFISSIIPIVCLLGLGPLGLLCLLGPLGRLVPLGFSLEAAFKTLIGLSFAWAVWISEAFVGCGLGAFPPPLCLLLNVCRMGLVGGLLGTLGTPLMPRQSAEM